MAGHGPAIHVCLSQAKDVDAREGREHDAE
jgi:hypothetical protein